MSTINDDQLISKIANRWNGALVAAGLQQIEKLDLVMDIEYAHKDQPLNLEELLNADNENFNHDLGGIIRNFNRETMTMDNCFVPRFTNDKPAEQDTESESSVGEVGR